MATARESGRPFPSSYLGSPPPSLGCSGGRPSQPTATDGQVNLAPCGYRSSGRVSGAGPLFTRSGPPEEEWREQAENEEAKQDDQRHRLEPSLSRSGTHAVRWSPLGPYSVVGQIESRRDDRALGARAGRPDSTPLPPPYSSTRLHKLFLW
jgi:hypothetical protein